jgi:hypothetical protein
MDPNARRKLGLVGTGFLIVGGIVLLIAAIQAGEKLITLKTWTPTQAEFLSADLVNDKINVTIGTARADNYRVNWNFRYNVGGATHVASTDPGTPGRFSEASKWLNRFQKGQQYTIQVKPTNPDVISADAYDWITFAHAAWVAMWGFGIFVFGLLLRKLSRA